MPTTTSRTRLAAIADLRAQPRQCPPAKLAPATVATEQSVHVHPAHHHPQPVGVYAVATSTGRPEARGFGPLANLTARAASSMAPAAVAH